MHKIALFFARQKIFARQAVTFPAYKLRNLLNNYTSKLLCYYRVR